MSRFDFDRFLKGIEQLDYIEIIARVSSEIRSAESMAYDRPGAKKAREDGVLSYARSLNDLMGLLSTGVPPMGMSQWQIGQIRPILERLVEKGQLKPEILKNL